VPYTIERRSSLSPSGPEGSARSNDDFVILDDHLVRDLPRLLAEIERRIRDRAERREVDPTEEEADDRRRLRVRRWAVLVLAAVAAAFLFLEATGAVPHAFSGTGRCSPLRYT
jgi:anti-sigma-K factor RskA